MTLTSNDIKAIKDAIQPQFDGLHKEIKTVETGLRKEIKTVETGLRKEIKTIETSLSKEINDFRAEVRQMFKEQGIQISKAIADAIKLMTETHATKEEVEELREEIDELRERIKKIERFQKTS